MTTNFNKAHVAKIPAEEREKKHRHAWSLPGAAGLAI
jgi:hypothetical protein